MLVNIDQEEVKNLNASLKAGSINMKKLGQFLDSIESVTREVQVERSESLDET